jgi:hypothetical protein
MTARVFRASLALLLVLVWSPVWAQPALTAEQQEAFLKTAKVTRTRGAAKGVTGTIRATLSDGVLTHDASIQTVDQYMQVFQSKQGVEMNFRDSWRYNVAAYRLNQILRLGLVPVSVERNHNGKPGSFTWWVDDVIMDEGERLKQKAPIPDPEKWNRQMWHVRVFDQLIHNVDRNLGNLVIDKNWNVWMIDHSRAFRLSDTLKNPKDLRRIERGAFERLKALDAATLSEAMGQYLTSDERRRLLMRRDAIVKIFSEMGPNAFFDETTER